VLPAYIKDPPQAPLIQCVTFLASTLDRAQHSDPYNIIGKMQTLYSFYLVLRESRDFHYTELIIRLVDIQPVGLVM